jgi:hypothetical protein
VPKVESQERKAKSFSLFDMNWIDLELFSIHLPYPSNKACVFQVSSENKVDLVLVDVPSNLPIPHTS